MAALGLVVAVSVFALLVASIGLFRGARAARIIAFLASGVVLVTALAAWSNSQATGTHLFILAGSVFVGQVAFCLGLVKVLAAIKAEASSALEQ